MDLLSSSCAAQSVGPANSVFHLLIQTLLAAHCSVSSDTWPKDFGPKAIDEGVVFVWFCFVLK